MTDIRYFSVTAPAAWNDSGTTKVTVRTGGRCEVYLCVGNGRMAITQDQAWALWLALRTALAESFGPMPDWATQHNALSPQEQTQ
ncbi:hypothetical protein [Nonomuraea bangladeshensis]|uniref:hypothetical protein n=1 Tax=Nonomuraea bangladeshensis TaxID=404385 RepID=UPI003C2DDD12